MISSRSPIGGTSFSNKRYARIRKRKHAEKEGREDLWGTQHGIGPSEMIDVNHGGGKHYLEHMMKAKNESMGYKLEGGMGKGIQVHPSVQGKYRNGAGEDANRIGYYSKRAGGYGDIPAKLTGQIEGSKLTAANNGYEAGIRGQNMGSLKNVKIEETGVAPDHMYIPGIKIPETDERAIKAMQNNTFGKNTMSDIDKEVKGVFRSEKNRAARMRKKKKNPWVSKKQKRLASLDQENMNANQRRYMADKTYNQGERGGGLHEQYGIPGLGKHDTPINDSTSINRAINNNGTNGPKSLHGDNVDAHRLYKARASLSRKARVKQTKEGDRILQEDLAKMKKENAARKAERKAEREAEREAEMESENVRPGKARSEEVEPNAQNTAQSLRNKRIGYGLGGVGLAAAAYGGNKMMQSNESNSPKKKNSGLKSLVA